MFNKKLFQQLKEMVVNKIQHHHQLLLMQRPPAPSYRTGCQ
jgi:hypothetical protein